MATLTIECSISNCNINVNVKDDGLHHELEWSTQRLEEHLRRVHVSLPYLALAENALDTGSLADAPSTAQEDGFCIGFREPEDKNDDGESAKP